MYHVQLNTGAALPLLGLGVYQSAPGESTQQAVEWALATGYRHIDTARLYRNEADVGAALRNSGIARDEVFVTTKLWNSDHGYDSALRAFEASLKDLGLETVDLYLIHWPVHPLRRESWRALEAIAQSGQARAIGVSNYTIRHLEELLTYCETVPAVNQVEFSPYLYQRDLLHFCQQQGIQLMAYSPLTQGHKLSDPPLQAIAAKHHKTPAQILLRWTIEHQIAVIPKSVKQARIQENAAIFDFTLDPADMAALNHLNQNFRTCWDPTQAP